jgi:peptide/nickel transport system permease protein
MKPLMSLRSLFQGWRLPFAVLGLIVIASLLGALAAPYDPLAEVGESLGPPSWVHPFGTDLIGRDVFSRVLHGGGRTLFIAALAVVCSVLPGVLVGLAAGYVGRSLDAALTAILDALLAIPALLVALSVVALTGSGPAQVALAVGISGLPACARITRAATRTARAMPHVEAARGLGARPLHILVFHVLPGIAGPVIAFVGIALSWAILHAATLNFLGFGGDPAAPEWGVMLAEGRQVYRVAPWVAVAPGAAIMITLFTVNLLADALRRR